MTDMVERVAEEMVRTMESVDWEDPARENLFRVLARVAIEAMRNPTVEMVDGGVKAEGVGSSHHCVQEQYRAMIGVALSPPA